MALEGIPVPLLLSGAIVAFAAFWIAVTSLIGWLSGWFRLQEEFPDRTMPALAVLHMQSARIGMLANYNNCLRVDVCAIGLRLAVPRVLGMFQKPLFVPWNAIHPEDCSVLGIRRYCLRFSGEKPGKVRLFLSERNFRKISANSPLQEP